MDWDFRKGAKFPEHIVPQRLRDTLARVPELRHETIQRKAGYNL
jgi:hypothetical protein